MKKKNIDKHRNKKTPMDDLEREKLELELIQLRRPWFLKPGYLGGVILPFILTGLALIKVWTTGYFDNERIRLSNELKELIDTVKYFQSEKIKVQSEFEQINYWKTAYTKSSMVLDDQVTWYQLKRYGTKNVFKTMALERIVRLLSEIEVEADSLIQNIKDSCIGYANGGLAMLKPSNPQRFIYANPEDGYLDMIKALDERCQTFSEAISRKAVGLNPRYTFDETVNISAWSIRTLDSLNRQQ